MVQNVSKMRIFWPAAGEKNVIFGIFMKVPPLVGGDLTTRGGTFIRIALIPDPVPPQQILLFWDLIFWAARGPPRWV